MKSFSWKKLQNKWKSMSRTDWIVVLLLGVLLLVIAIPTGSGGTNQTGVSSERAQDTGDGSADGNSKQEEAVWENAQTAYMSWYRQQLESELAELLAGMDGVGQARVMLTLKDSGADVLDKNTKQGADTSETDTVVYSGTDGEEPYVTNRYTPEVAGVFIVAEGGGNAVVVSDISDAVMALFGIEAHKIKVAKMSD